MSDYAIDDLRAELAVAQRRVQVTQHLLEFLRDDVEEAIRRRGVSKGGQQVPDHSDLASVPLSGLLRLRRRVRDMLDALGVGPPASVG